MDHQLMTTRKKQGKQRNGTSKFLPPIDYAAMTYGKVPPQAKELEEVVLGAIMQEKSAFDIAAEIVTADMFYVDAHQRIFKAFASLNQKSSAIDILTTVEELKAMEELDMVGGPYYVTSLTNKVMSSANLETHCRIVKEKYLKRDLIRISGETITSAFEDGTDAFDLLDEHETQIVTLTNGFIKGAIQSSEELAVKAIQRIDFLRTHKEELSGVNTGFPALNKLTNGWQPTDLIILAARPSVGKTAFALNLARNAATSSIKPVGVGFFSLEMSAGQLVQRILSTESQVGLDKITRGRVYDEDYDKVLKATDRFSRMPIFIDDTAALNVMEFRAKARRLVSKHKVGLIIIDYLQLMSGMGGGNREQEISTISRNLKALAKELHIPIIALSQMSRAIEAAKREPMLSDLRESGAIEQDADMVCFLFRPDYQQSKDEGDATVKGDAFLKISKHRNGDLEKLPFKTELRYQTWYEPQQYEEHQKQSEYFPSGNWKKVEHENISSTPALGDTDEDLPF
jgi:replicative DNA helicase